MFFRPKNNQIYVKTGIHLSMSPSNEDPMAKISKKFLRDVPNWDNAPVQICMGGDYRALTFCCKPGHSLTFGYKCLRDEKLKEVGMTSEVFMQIKQEFSTEHEWDSDTTCFGSLSYCCMRNSGCYRRDAALAKAYPGKSFDEVKADYFGRKKELAKIILKKVQNQELVKGFLDHC